MLSGQRAMAHVLKRVYGCRYIPIKYIQTYVAIYMYIWQRCLIFAMHARVRISACLSRCVSASTHTHTHSVSCATVCRSCICLSVATTSPLPPLLSLHPLYNICILAQLGPIVILFGRLTVSRSAPAVVYNMSGHRCRPGMYNASTYVSLRVCVCVCLTERIIEHPLGQTR